MELGDAQLRPFWGKAEGLDAVIFIHPGGNRDRRFKRFISGTASDKHSRRQWRSRR